MTKMRSRLPGKATEASNIDAFISAVEPSIRPPDTTVKAYPWQEQNVRADVCKVYNLRLPEPYLMKLKYIAEHTPNSMQKFCLGILQEAIDEKIAELTD